ncbi:MAG TPA: ATP-binding cassette domain-containing protein [Frankiaceae bacterium]|nr:ATP-binding cassette domain-containing protein [Frankiaceae bacterium]
MRGSLQVEAQLPERDFDVSLQLEPGEVVAVLGPNGAGKSTLLGLIAGLLRPDSGRICLDGTVLVDGRTWTPPHARPVALLAQQALLFPHLTVRENVAFGPRSRSRDRSAARAVADEWLDAVDARDLASRRPAQLSGGQQQRVAVARALAVDPHLLLLDEPMAALDVGAAPALRQLLRRVLSDGRRSALLVTHDVLDALMLADRVVVLESGRIVEQGPVRAVFSAPRSAFTARIAGINLLVGRATEGGLTTRDGGEVVGRPDGAEPGEPAVAVFHPSAVAVYRDAPHGSPRNSLEVVVGELEPRGDLVRVHATSGLAADITLGSVADLALSPGDRAVFTVKATEVRVLPSAR